MTSILLFALFILSVVCAADTDSHSHLHKRQSPGTLVGTAASPTPTPATPTEEPDREEPTRASTSVTDSPSTPASPTLPSLPSETVAVTEDPPPSRPPPPTTTREPTEEPTAGPVTTSNRAPSGDTPASSPALPTPPRSQLTLLTTTAPQSIQSDAMVTTTIVTVSDGSTMLQVITTSVSLTAPSSTASPSLNGSSGGSSSSGITPSQKRTIIGVVVGIGGAILIGALAVVAWRIWGRKKHNVHDDDMYDPNMSLKERPSTGSGTNPFKSTLDQYHNPAPVNTASNF